MPQRRKLFGLGLAIVVMAAVTLIAGWFHSMRPLTEQELLAADHLDFIEEQAIPDGGSFVFFFALPHKRSVAIQVLHRRADMGGNPDFQEIRIDRLGAMNPYIDLRPGSPLESHLLSLLQTARTDTNAAVPHTEFTFPRPERLRWLMDRIRDRKAKW
jgi:hypothetical protein